MTIKPLRNMMLLRALPHIKVTTGGIHLVDRFHDDRMQWRVEAIGPGCKEVKVGDRILTPLNFTHMTLDDGRKLVGEEQAIMVWGRDEL